jgi:hypothetical protein
MKATFSGDTSGGTLTVSNGINRRAQKYIFFQVAHECVSNIVNQSSAKDCKLRAIDCERTWIEIQPVGIYERLAGDP